MYSITDMLKDLMPFFIAPVAIMILTKVFEIAKEIIHGSYMDDMAEELMKENEKLIKKEETKTKNIDNDLQKYFNYKE